MIRGIAERLDEWVTQTNLEAQAEGMRRLPPCHIRVLGQTALLEVGSGLSLLATSDVDVYADYEYPIEVEFKRLLRLEGKELDPVGHKIWMPRETEYVRLFQGRFIRLSVADPDAVLISKSARAPDKNRSLLTEYLASGASQRFLSLATQYKVDLERFL